MIEQLKRHFTPGHTVLAPLKGTSAFGGKPVTWEPVLTFSALLRPLSGTETLSADKITYVLTHKLYCDVIAITNLNRYRDPQGNVYHIRFVKNPMNFNSHYEIDLEMISHGH